MAKRAKSKAASAPQRVRHLIALDASNVMRRLEARHAEMVALFSRLRDRAPMLETVHSWFDTAGFPFPTQLPTLLEVVGDHRVLYGSDHCWTPTPGVAAQIAMIDHAGAGGRRGRVGRGDGDGGVGAEIVAGDVVPIAFDAAVSAEDPCLAMARFGEGGDGMGGGDAVGVVEGDDLVVDDIVVAFVDAAAVGPVGERLGEGNGGCHGGKSLTGRVSVQYA